MGTKMMLHRYSPVTKDWDETLYIVDENFLNTYGNIDVIISTNYVYEPNKQLLKVYLNGQRLLSGGAYLEVDDSHIQLTLGKDENGEPIRLELSDEIFIEIYKNQYCSRGQATISGTQFYELQKEVYEARQFRDTDQPYKTLDERLDEIQRQIEVAHGGNADVDITYEYNTKGRMIREIITGDYKIVREFTYYEEDAPLIKGEMKTETIYYADQDGSLTNQVTKTYSYDHATRRLLRTGVRSDM
ncbi:hypothetical protein [Metabacillus fastidiosus]|uniref:hypothetical protein n=1 Tax=Metabacillus fastidiosus TaxID=1458 RepID=UPI003D2A519F